jgi:hypothetical protein
MRLTRSGFRKFLAARGRRHAGWVGLSSPVNGSTSTHCPIAEYRNSRRSKGDTVRRSYTDWSGPFPSWADQFVSTVDALGQMRISGNGALRILDGIK